MPYTENVVMPTGLDWGLWAAVDNVIRERAESLPVTAYTIGDYEGFWDGGDASCETLAELREDATGREVRRVRLGYRRWKDSASTGYRLERTDKEWAHLEVWAGTREDAVALAHVVRREIERHEAGGPEVTAAAVPTPVSVPSVSDGSSVRNLWSNPNPWVVTVVGTVLAALIFGLLTDWFGLAS